MIQNISESNTCCQFLFGYSGAPENIREQEIASAETPSQNPSLHAEDAPTQHGVVWGDNRVAPLSLVAAQTTKYAAPYLLAVSRIHEPATCLASGDKTWILLNAWISR